MTEFAGTATTVAPASPFAALRPDAPVSRVTDARDLPEVLRPAIEAFAVAADRDRRLPAALVEVLRGAGAFALSTPARYGGLEASLVTMCDVYERLGALDAAVAWNVWNGACGFSAALLEPEAVAEVWSGDGDPIIANSARVVGVARADGEDFVLSGRWDIVSAIDIAEWVTVFGMVMDGDHPAVGAGGAPDVRAFFLRRGQYEVLDTWHTTGMRGSGSNTVVVRDAVVPSRMAVSPFAPPRIPEARYRIPAFTLASTGAAPIVVGVAQAAIDEVIAMAATKPTDNGQVLATRAHAQSQVGAAQTALHGARLLLRDAARAIDDAADAGQPIDDRLRATLRAAMSHAARTAREVLGVCQRLASSTALYTDNRIEHLVRDGTAAAQHFILAETHLDIFGRLLLGQDPGTPII